MALSADGKTALTGGEDKTACVWKVPQPIRCDPERIKLWAQLVTGLEVDELTAVRVLDAATLPIYPVLAEMPVFLVAGSGGRQMGNWFEEVDEGKTHGGWA